MDPAGLPTGVLAAEASLRYGKAVSPWRDVPDAEWTDWRWQLRNLIRSVDEVARFLPIAPQDLDRLRGLGKAFHFAVTPYYFSLIDREDPFDPIRILTVPSVEEDEDTGDDDPLGEGADMVAPGITHRYPDRVLFTVTSFCTSYCRHCTRKRNWRHSSAASSRADLDQALAYIEQHEEVRDVLVSGGDPLTQPLERLDYILGGIRRIGHVEVIRIGSREPVMLPMRITDDLVRTLEKYHPLWINTHFNHAREVTPEAMAACDRLLRAGIPLNNQTVLLRGVNDSVQTMRNLVHALGRARVRPYYLYMCDAVKGVAHLRTSVWKGIEIMEGLRGHTSGFLVPQFVVDTPEGGGKIPLMPNYLVSASPGRLVLRNYEGRIVAYDDPAGNTAARPAEAIEGVVSLLERRREVLVPTGAVGTNGRGGATSSDGGGRTATPVRRRRVGRNGNGNGTGRNRA